ncbi:MAG TPA: ribonuclease P protein component [Micromonosporaceae bacterium]
MLAADQRLRRRQDFTATMRAGRRARRGALVVHLAVRSGVDEPAVDVGPMAAARAGLVIPRAVGTAVTRNKVRRRLRHLLRSRLASLPPGTDLVVRVLPEASQRSFLDLGADLDGAVRTLRENRPKRLDSPDSSQSESSRRRGVTR